MRFIGVHYSMHTRTVIPFTTAFSGIANGVCMALVACYTLFGVRYS